MAGTTPNPDARAGRPSLKEYVGQGVTVTFEPGRCVHAAECVTGLPQVFDTAKRPWIQPDGATADRVAEVVRRCPSGALHYRSAGTAEESPDVPTSVTRSSTGQLVLRGDLAVTTPEGVRHETRVTLCGCGTSRNQPYCDHSGACAAE